MTRLGMEEGEAIEAKMLSRQIERAQRKVEMRNFDIRKHLLEYDNVMNKQRTSIYSWRIDVLGMEDLTDEYREMAEGLVEDLLDTFAPPKQDVDVEGLAAAFHDQFGVQVEPDEPPLAPDAERDALLDALTKRAAVRLDEQIAMFRDLEENFADLRPPTLQSVARGFLLESIDVNWKEHLLAMDHLKEGINLRGYAQRDPKVEYQREAFAMFQEMGQRIRSRAVQQLFRVVFETPTPEQMDQLRAREEARRRAAERRMQEQHAAASAGMAGGASGMAEVARASEERGRPQTVVRDAPKVGRNDPCPCGSGKKYKKCCGAA